MHKSQPLPDKKKKPKIKRLSLDINSKPVISNIYRDTVLLKRMDKLPVEITQNIVNMKEIQLENELKIYHFIRISLDMFSSETNRSPNRYSDQEYDFNSDDYCISDGEPTTSDDSTAQYVKARTIISDMVFPNKYKLSVKDARYYLDNKEHHTHAIMFNPITPVSYNIYKPNSKKVLKQIEKFLSDNKNIYLSNKYIKFDYNMYNQVVFVKGDFIEWFIKYNKKLLKLLNIYIKARELCESKYSSIQMKQYRKKLCEWYNKHSSIIENYYKYKTIHLWSSIDM